MLALRTSTGTVHPYTKVRATARFLQHRRSLTTALAPLTVAPSHPSKSPTNPLGLSLASHRTVQISRHFSNTPRQSSDTMSSHGNTAGYTVRKNGAPNTLEHRVYIEKDGTPVSSFHDIPLYANEQQTVLNMIVEIPRWTNAKMEVCSPPKKLNAPHRKQRKYKNRD